MKLVTPRLAYGGLNVGNLLVTKYSDRFNYTHSIAQVNRRYVSIIYIHGIYY